MFIIVKMIDEGRYGIEGGLNHMTDASVFLISEIWLNHEMFDQYKTYRQKTLDILMKYNAEYVYHGHPFDWHRNPDADPHPTGIEVFHFHNEDDTRKALEELNDPLLKEDEARIFLKVRSYLSRYAMSWNCHDMNDAGGRSAATKKKNS